MKNKKIIKKWQIEQASEVINLFVNNVLIKSTDINPVKVGGNSDSSKDYIEEWAKVRQKLPVVLSESEIQQIFSLTLSHILTE